MTPLEWKHLLELPEKYGATYFSARDYIDSNLTYDENKRILINELERRGFKKQNEERVSFEKEETQFESELAAKVKEVVFSEFEPLFKRLDYLESILAKTEKPPSELVERVRRLEEEIREFRVAGKIPPHFAERLAKLEEDIKTIEHIKRSEAWYMAGPGGYIYFSQYITTLWNAMINLQSAVKGGNRSPAIKNKFESLSAEITDLVKKVKHTDLEERMKMLVELMENVKRLLES